MTAIALLLGYHLATAQTERAGLPIWPDHVVPDGWKIDEREISKTTDGVTRLRHVSKPTLTHFPAQGKSPTDMAVVICPGGGYNILAIDKEGWEIAEFLAEHGIHAFVLKYRLPRKDEATRYGPALQDAQRAIRVIRHRAPEWGIALHKIGIMGFSAGGHLSAVTSTRSNTPHYEAKDDIDAVSCRPDFCGLAYPAYLVTKTSPTQITAELTISKTTPPTFLVQTSDDPVLVENSIYYYLALKQHQIPAQLHVFHQGPHGYGLRPKDIPVGTWPHRFVEWLDSLSLTSTQDTDTSLVSADSSTLTNIYVSLGGENKIAVYSQDAPTGTLTLSQTVEVNGAPGSLAVSKDKRFLYAALRSTTQVASFAVDALDGTLSLLGTTKVAGSPVYIQPDSTGRHLFYASYGDDEAAVYPIEKDGIVQASATWKAATKSHPHSIGAHPQHPNFVVIPNTGSSVVQPYQFDSKAGTLTLLDEIIVEPETGPRHFAFNEDHFYTVNETASSVTAYSFTASEGLKTLHTISTLPDGFEGSNSCADIHITPDGSFLYATNRGHDSLAAYAIQNGSGELIFLDTFPTEKTPREFDIDPAGRYLYAAGQGSGRLAAYRIQKDGALEPFATYEVGKNPTWVLATAITRP